ncbi:hypothetical protein [Prosthecobacter sp.]|uniref:hypothetical protein n=1 Tax=Prosthecobacter sp. TaxID=1965333 RepID=UPI0037830714
MSSRWKAFFGEFVLLFTLGVACSYLASIWIHDKYPDLERPVATRISMSLGALGASVIVSLAAALRFWRLKPLLGAVVLCSGLISGIPAVALTALFLSSLTYVAVNKIRLVGGYYWPVKSMDRGE